MANQLKMALIETILTLHRRRWSQRRIARELNIHRETVARYLREASGRSKPAKAPIGSELGDGDSKPAKAPIGSEAVAKEAPTEATIGAEADSALSRSLCAPWRDIILDKLQAGLTAQRIYQDLVSDHGFCGHYHSVRRFVRRLGTKRDLPFRRMECAPGEEAQIDFGSGIPIIGADGKRRRTHVFRIVLSHSRKAYSEAVYRQTTDARVFEIGHVCMPGLQDRLPRAGDKGKFAAARNHHWLRHDVLARLVGINRVGEMIGALQNAVGKAVRLRMRGGS